MNMETDALRWFQQVADGVTVTEVAQVCRVSQPGVSRALARLEDEVGAPLLHKVGRGLRLTHAGSVFKRHVDAVLHGLDDGLAAVDELVDPTSGTVTVAFQLSLGAWLVPRLVAQFRQDHPLVRFQLRQSDDTQGSSLLTGGRIDLEITSRRPRGSELQWHRLFSQPLVLAVPPGHRFVERSEIDLSETSGEDFVMLRPGWELRGLTDDLCANAGITARVAFECDDLPVVQGFVAAGLGIAIVPAMDARDLPRSRVSERYIAIADAGAHREVGLVWSHNRRLLPSAELFRQHVVASGLRPTADGYRAH